MSKLVGNKPSQVPTNADLGTLAYQDKDDYIKSYGDISLNGDTSITGDVDIASGKKLGVGTSSPAAAVHVNTSTNTPLLVESTHGDGGYVELQLSDSGGAGSLTGYIGDSQALVASGSAGDLAIRAQSNFVVSTGGSAERLRINASGAINFHNGYLAQPSTGEGFVYITDTSSITVGVSTTSSANAMSFRNGNGEKGIININGNTVSFTNLSDYREKENVEYSFDATSRLKQLKPCRFNWISDSTNTLQDGFLAHEVSSICPEAVVGEKDGVYTADDVALEPHLVEGEAKNQMLDATKLIPLMVKTIQELEARITELENA